jgi:hypothetical protein
MSGPSYAEQLQHIVQQYMERGMPWPATSREVAAWAIEHGLWQAPLNTIVSKCAGDLSRAMREEYITDPQGRTVRAKHAARMKRDNTQLSLWADIRTADPAFMAVSFQQRRQQIVGDCRQLKLDVDSYNENARPARPIQMVFDFRDDLLELEALEQAARTRQTEAVAA